MTGARGDALEWALALARAPGERHALRQRPLPDGIEALLQIAAGGHGGALQSALARSGETEATLVEAARFYLREVLFHPDADAYRLLGLSPDAGAEQVKAHHRLLQQWLHPDRRTSDSDAIFAGRVNAAWNALRTPERRAEYDASRPVEVAVDAAPAMTRWVAPRVVADPPPMADDSAARWRRRAPVLAMFAACGVLGIAAVRDALREPDSHYGTEAGQGESAIDHEADALPLQPPAAARAPAVDRRATAVPRRSSVPPRSSVGQLAASPLAASANEPSPRPAALTPASKPVATAKASAPMPAAARDAVARAVPPTVVAPAIPAPEPARVASKPAAVQSPARAAARTTPAETPAPVAIAATAPAPAPAPVSAAAIPPERIQQAQRTGRQLLTFLSARSGAVPPIWDSLDAQQRALRLRDSLHASGDTYAGDPRWRVDREEAALQAAFGDDTQVRAQLVWREQRWLVSGVAVELRP